jgi:hypothetical protein
MEQQAWANKHKSADETKERLAGIHIFKEGIFSQKYVKIS